MSFSPLVERLMESLRVLPGVGPKTAQRMAMHLLERDRDGGRRLAGVLERPSSRSATAGAAAPSPRRRSAACVPAAGATTPCCAW